MRKKKEISIKKFPTLLLKSSNFLIKSDKGLNFKEAQFAPLFFVFPR